MNIKYSTPCDAGLPVEYKRGDQNGHRERVQTTEEDLQTVGELALQIYTC